MSKKKQKFTIPDPAKTRPLSDKFDLPYEEVVAAYLKFGPQRNLRQLERWLKSLKLACVPKYDTTREWHHRFNWSALAHEYDKVYHTEMVQAIESVQDAKDKAKIEKQYSKQGRRGRPLKTAESYPYDELKFKAKKDFNERQDLIDTAEITLFSLRTFVKRNRIMSWQDAERACKMAQDCLILAEKLVGTVTAKRAEEKAKPADQATVQAEDKYTDYMTMLEQRSANLNGDKKLN